MAMPQTKEQWDALAKLIRDEPNFLVFPPPLYRLLEPKSKVPTTFVWNKPLPGA